jgi:formylmethanofuran dehydrogenase subunit E
MEKKMTKQKSKHSAGDTDENVQRMVETWDIVRCHQCGKNISMLNAKIVNGKYFICKGIH